jgi:Tn7-like transposition protein D
LREITRSKDKAHHPLFHAVLRVFLASMQPTKALPFGAPPWPCRNPLAGHFGQPTIMSSRRHRNHKTVVAVFECGCGYIYTRCLYFDGRVGPPRYQSYGPLLEAALRQAVVSGSSLRSIARSVALDPKTLLRELASLGISSPWRCRDSGRARRTRPRPLATGRTARAVRTASRPRVDWATLDAKLVARLRRIADTIKAARPPVRVTLAELDRRLGHREWIRKRRAKLPLSNSETDALAEPLADFQHRRIAWAIEEAHRTGTPLIAWRVMRAAGLAHRYLPMIEEVIAAAAGGFGMTRCPDSPQ